MRVLTGIYQILNVVNGKFYIGKSKNILKRWHNHRSKLRRNLSKSPYLQAAWNKYGETAFEFIIVEICVCDDLEKCEQYWIDKLGACDRELGYNSNPNSETSLGAVCSLATRIKIANANRGKIRTLEQKERLSQAQILRQKQFGTSKETIAKISAAQKGRKQPNDKVAKMALAHRKPNKWPHPWGVKCICDECLEKRRAYARNYARQKRQITGVEF